MTEDEAKTKWCPQAVASHTNPRQGFDGVPGFTPIFPCLGSACMWWRWISKAGTGEDGTANYYTGKWKGYCGVAGKP